MTQMPAERQERILEAIRDRRAVRVAELAAELATSQVTVRRDLEALERAGLLRRTHGGAIAASGAVAVRDVANAGEKRAIGEAAAALVEPGDTVFLNGGTTTLEVFRRLRASGLKVVTNNIAAAQEATGREVELVLLGGHVRPASATVVGPFATDALRRTNATVAFVGVEGVSVEHGFTTPVAAEAEVARLMIEQTRGRVIVVADRSKIDRVSDFQIAPLGEARLLVTDARLRSADRRKLEEAGLEVLTAD